MDPTALAAKASIGIFARRLGALTTQAKYDAAFRKMADDAIFEIDAQVQRVVVRQLGLGDKVERLEERISDAEFIENFRRLAQEAASSSAEDRRRLFAVAIASGLRPDFEQEERSRIVRALLMLETSDILRLRAIDNPPPPTGVGSGWPSAPQPPHMRDYTAEMSEEALRGALCIPFDQHQMGLTPLGDAVLRFVEDWQPLATPGAPDPAR